MNKNLKRRAADVAKAERELSETDAAVPRLEEETRAVLARIGADLVAGTITDREADRLREQAEGEARPAAPTGRRAPAGAARVSPPGVKPPKRTRARPGSRS